MTLVSISVEFFVDANDEPEEYLDMISYMAWLTYLRENSVRIDSTKHYNPNTYQYLANYYFYLPEELASFYYLAYG